MTRSSTPLCGIYAIRRIGTSECYVGQSVDIKHRWCGHKKTLEKGAHRARWLQRAFAKYGAEAFEFVVLEIVEAREALTAAEQAWMDRLSPCYNTTPAAGSVAGLVWPEGSKVARSEWAKQRAKTEEGLQHLRRIRAGRPSPWKGKTPSPETREKMRQAKLGKPSNRLGQTATEETKAKLREARQRIPARHTTKHTEESKAKIAAAMMGRKASPETREKMRQAHALRRARAQQSK